MKCTAPLTPPIATPTEGIPRDAPCSVVSSMTRLEVRLAEGSGVCEHVSAAREEGKRESSFIQAFWLKGGMCKAPPHL